MRPILPVLLPALLGIAACATPPAPPPPVVSAPAPPPIPGLERLLGQPATTATGLLGSPTLDRSDGLGRHLQFARAGCVLDLYYYPDPRAGQPTARYAEARQNDGKTDVPARCFAAQLAGRTG